MESMKPRSLTPLCWMPRSSRRSTAWRNTALDTAKARWCTQPGSVGVRSKTAVRCSLVKTVISRPSPGSKYRWPSSGLSRLGWSKTKGMPSTPSQKSIDVRRSAPTIVMWWTPWLWILRMRASLDPRLSCQDPYVFLSVALRLLPMVAPMRCRIVAFVAGLLVFAMLGTGPVLASKGAYFGTAVEPAPGQSTEQALASLERTVGRHFHMFRLYRALNNTTLRGGPAKLMKSRGQPMYLNVTSEIGNRCVSWRSVAAGTYNRYLHSIARQVKRYRYRVYFSWNHEMQGNCKTGTAADYRA